MRHLISVLLLGSMAWVCSVSAQNNGQLFIFLQHGRSMSEDFKRNALPGIEAFAERQKIQVKILDAREGAPAEVRFTPALVFQNEKGRSVFQGRYRKLNQVEKFIEKARQSPQMEMIDFQEGTPTWTIGRATLAAPLKVMPLTGRVPANFDQEQFGREALRSIAAGMDYFQLQKMDGLPAETRVFRMEFYPEKTSDGLLLVSMKLYSEFNPDQPVFETGLPSGGEWGDPDLVWRKAGNRLEKALLAQISNWDNGDGFDTLSDKTPVKSWQELGLEASSSPKGVGK